MPKTKHISPNISLDSPSEIHPPQAGEVLIGSTHGDKAEFARKIQAGISIGSTHGNGANFARGIQAGIAIGSTHGDYAHFARKMGSGISIGSTHGDIAHFALGMTGGIAIGSTHSYRAHFARDMIAGIAIGSTHGDYAHFARDMIAGIAIGSTNGHKADFAWNMTGGISIGSTHSYGAHIAPDMQAGISIGSTNGYKAHIAPDMKGGISIGSTHGAGACFAPGMTGGIAINTETNEIRIGKKTARESTSSGLKPQIETIKKAHDSLSLLKELQKIGSIKGGKMTVNGEKLSREYSTIWKSLSAGWEGFPVIPWTSEDHENLENKNVPADIQVLYTALHSKKKIYFSAGTGKTKSKIQLTPKPNTEKMTYEKWLKNAGMHTAFSDIKDAIGEILNTLEQENNKDWNKILEKETKNFSKNFNLKEEFLVRNHI